MLLAACAVALCASAVATSRGLLWNNWGAAQEHPVASCSVENYMCELGGACSARVPYMHPAACPGHPQPALSFPRPPIPLALCRPLPPSPAAAWMATTSAWAASACAALTVSSPRAWGGAGRVGHAWGAPTRHTNGERRPATQPTTSNHVGPALACTQRNTHKLRRQPSTCSAAHAHLHLPPLPTLPPPCRHLLRDPARLDAR